METEIFNNIIIKSTVLNNISESNCFKKNEVLNKID